MRAQGPIRAFVEAHAGEYDVDRAVLEAAHPALGLEPLGCLARGRRRQLADQVEDAVARHTHPQQLGEEGAGPAVSAAHPGHPRHVHDGLRPAVRDPPRDHRPRVGGRHLGRPLVAPVGGAAVVDHVRDRARDHAAHSRAPDLPLARAVGAAALVGLAGVGGRGDPLDGSSRTEHALPVAAPRRSRDEQGRPAELAHDRAELAGERLRACAVRLVDHDQPPGQARAALAQGRDHDLPPAGLAGRSP